MASTPEAKVKKKVKAVLAKFKPHLHAYWPVPSGYGESHLDCIICFHGRYIAIETKAPGKSPTPRQWMKIADVNGAKGYVFVISEGEGAYTAEDLEADLNILNATFKGE